MSRAAERHAQILDQIIRPFDLSHEFGRKRAYEAAIEYAREMGGAPQASVVAGGFKTSMQNAAYANGTMAHALDFDNTWYPLNHPTSPTLPARTTSA